MIVTILILNFLAAWSYRRTKCVTTQREIKEYTGLADLIPQCTAVQHFQIEVPEKKIYSNISPIVLRVIPRRGIVVTTE